MINELSEEFPSIETCLLGKNLLNTDVRLEKGNSIQRQLYTKIQIVDTMKFGGKSNKLNELSQVTADV